VPHRGTWGGGRYVLTDREVHLFIFVWYNINSFSALVLPGVFGAEDNLLTMARIGYLIIPEGYDETYYKSLKPGDRFQFPRMTRKPMFYSWQRRKNLTRHSLLPIIAEEWGKLNASQKDAWNVAGTFTDLNGWRLFVSDMVNRIKGGISGVATPSIYHQSRVGAITLSGLGDYIKIVQYHPQTYWTRSKIIGSKSRYTQILVREDFSLPLQLKISYKSSLVSTGPGSYAKFYAIVYTLYQGKTIENKVEIPFEFVHDWSIEESQLNEVLGQAIGYTLFIECYNLQGSLYFDNIHVIHNEQNWARGWQCNTIETQFTRAFYQIPRFWAPILLPEGAGYFSTYPND